MKRSTWLRYPSNETALRALLSLVFLVALLATGNGCTRTFYRKSIDNEVNDILAEKDKYDEWRIEQFHVYPDPRARFADDCNPDRPPMPPDDEATWKLTPHPQQPGRSGVAQIQNTAFLEIIRTWDAQNRADRAAWAEAAKKDPAPQQSGVADTLYGSGPIQNMVDAPNQQGFLLTLDQAVELGLINSREYQSFREDLYLAALPVTLQRFNFAWQWTAGVEAIRRWAGPNSSTGYSNSWNVGSGVSVGKLFSTGALLTAAFANKTAFNFTNSAAKGFTTDSTINLDLIQPLLQGGGKAVTLEPLTQSERNLMYSIRSYARFREQFYTSVALGSGLPNSLAGAAGGGGGGPISPLAALGIASTNVSGQFRGFLPALYRQLDLATDVKYVRDLEKALKLYEAYLEGGQVAPLQVDQVRSTLYQTRNTVLQDLQDWTNSLDQLKLQLGLPANLPLVLDDSPGRPITRQLDRYYEILDQSDALYKSIERQDQVPAAALRPFLQEALTKDALVRGTAFQQKLPSSWAGWAKVPDKDLQTQLEALRRERNQLLDLKTELEVKQQALAPEQTQRLTNIEFELDVGGLEQVLRRYESRPWEKLKKEDQRLEQIKLFRSFTYSVQLVLVWAQ